MKQEPDKLRSHAEQRLQERPQLGVVTPSPAQSVRLVHELQVHQIELELQNEELMRARSEMVDAMARYADFYDFSPTGFISLARNGLILQINLAGAAMLGTVRGLLNGRGLPEFIEWRERPVFNAFLQQVFATEAKQRCTLTLVQDDRLPIQVLIEAMRSVCQQECRAVLVDITDLTRQQKEKLIDEAAKRLTLEGEAERRTNELRTLEATGQQLQNALGADRNVNVAIGITMVQSVLGREDAFNQLRAAARQQRRRLEDLAAEVVHLAERPYGG